MLLQRADLTEAQLADFAPVRSLVRVRCHVASEAARLGERLLAHVALMRFFAGVD